MRKADTKVKITVWISLMTEISPGVCREVRREESSWEGFMEEVILGLQG